MKVKKGVRLTFDDVLIEPNISNIKSRNNVDITKVLELPGDGSITLFTPVISSCMDSVTGFDMALSMAAIGGLGIVHRYMSIAAMESGYKDAQRLSPEAPIGIAVGTNKTEQERFKILRDAGAFIFCVDTANGQSQYAADMVNWIKNLDLDNIVIAGNVATAEGFRWLQDAGADMVRVGIGGGSFCTTRTTTGIGIPQLSSILECAEVAEIPIIADGGIRKGSDAAKAFAAGADLLMLGGLLAGTDESPGDVRQDHYGNKYKIGRGMASKEAQKDYFHKENVIAEGIESKVPYKGSVKDVISNLLGGVRSAMTYVGANNLKEFEEKSTFVQITNAGLAESYPHILTY